MHTRKHQSAALRLALAFAVLVGILVAIGRLGLTGIDDVNTDLQNIVGRQRDKLRMVRDALNLSNANSRIAMEIFLLRDPSQISDAVATRTRNSESIVLLLEEISRRCDTEEEKSLLAAVRETRSPYIQSYQHALHLLVDENNREAGTQIIVQEMLPSLHKYHSAWAQFMQFEISRMDSAIEQSRVHYVRIHRQVLILIVAAVLVAGIIALFITRDIAREMKRRMAAEREVNQLNCGLEQRVAERTEQLTRAEEKTSHSLQELRKYTQQIETINQIVELLQSCFTLEEAYGQVARAFAKYFPSGALLMINHSRNLLDQVAGWGPAATKQGPFAPDSCWALRRGRIHIVEPDNFGQVCSHADQSEVGSYMCVPLIAHGESLGVIFIQEPGAEENSEVSRPKEAFAVTLAEQISLALANLRLRETLKYQSVRDPLTGLFNRRHMEESLQRELHRAARYRKQVPVLMMDLDHFKQFNDTFGHEAGDMVLREFGGLMTSQTRASDIACRYGGEEFVVILVEATVESARQRAEILREQVRNLQIKYRGEILRQVTVSIGIAGFPEHGATISQILNAADRALYTAKAEGRDRVVVAQTDPKLALSARAT